MLQAMLYKELRETLGLAGLGLLAYLCIVTGQMGMPLLPWLVGSRDAAIPFVGSEFLFRFCVVSVLLAVALGLRQSVAESVRGTWLLLLHRPAEHGRLIGVKLLVGAVVYLVCAALPILLYALWAATPGTHASPFEWSMTLWSWQAWVSIATLYFGAFLAGMRRARWFGSRLFPLAAAALLIGVIQIAPWWWLVGLGSLLLLNIWLVVNILYVARTRDY
jgi:hypothetical protein